MEKENVVYTYNAILFSLKRMPLVTTWPNLEDIHVKQNKPDTEGSTVQFHSYVGSKS